MTNQRGAVLMEPLVAVAILGLVVVAEEVKSGDWGIGGKVLTREDVKALMTVSK